MPVLGGIAALATPALALASGGVGGAAKVPDPAGDWTHLFHEVVTDITVIGVVFGLAAIYMIWRYRAKSPDDVGHGPTLTTVQSVALALVPALLFMADDFLLAAKGWVLYNTQRTVPADALEVKVSASQFYWEFDYGNGIVTSNEMKVPVGRPVVLRLSATDVIHSFFIPAMRIKEDAVPGRKTYLWFVAREPGTIIATCAEYCGVGHPQMPANIEAIPADRFDAWIKSGGKQASAPDAAPQG